MRTQVRGFVAFTIALICLIGAISYASAQQAGRLCIPTALGGCQIIGSEFPLPVGNVCTESAAVSVTSGNTTQIVALTAGETIRVCAFTITGSAAATVATFAYGTGTNCATGTTSITGGMLLAQNGGLSASSNGPLFSAAASNALCVTAATGNVTGFVTYAKY